MFDQRKNERYEGKGDLLEYSLGPFPGDELFEAEILNYSHTGICLRLAAHIPPGQEITIWHFSGSSSVTARVIWSEESADAYLAGLMFL